MFRRSHGAERKEQFIVLNVKGKWALITGASRGLGYLSSFYG